MTLVSAVAILCVFPLSILIHYHQAAKNVLIYKTIWKNLASHSFIRLFHAGINSSGYLEEHRPETGKEE